jgi:uncharacterized protein
MATTRPIFHLSIPVHDLDEAIAFYTTRLGAVTGRHESGWADVALFGAQVTLQHDAASVADPMPRTRHFGATLGWNAWESLTVRLADDVVFVEKPTISYVDTEREQAKVMIADPSGNLIEIKAYRNPQEVLGALAQA